MDFNADYWESRWQENHTGWDIGHVSTPIKEYADQLEDKAIDILIPGCGRAWEGQYLHEAGFTNVHLLDIAPSALQTFHERVQGFPSNHLLVDDFFKMERQFDLIIEQTFFCALDPKLRDQYVTKMYSLLYDNGKLVGLLFDAPLFTDRPPFGGNKVEYQSRFQNHFEIITMETSYNSHISRQGKELFINLRATKQS